jgi:anti-sigma-K factor RskA
MTGPDDDNDRGGGAAGPDDASAIAAEYVLGLLDPAEAAALEAILPEEPALRAEITAWQERFAGMAEDEVVPVAPPARLKGRVLDAAFGSDGEGVRTGLRLWRVVAAMGLVAALGLGAALLQQLAQAPAPERIAVPVPAPDVSHVARIAPTEGAPDFALVAAYVEETGALRISAPAGSPPTGRVLELWLIPRGGSVPVSLGLLPEAGGSVTVPAPLAAGIEGGMLAISDEPPGGSPTGAPTGTVLGTGDVLRL